ncbi:MAG: glycine--tRNA ligase subunit beta [Syntrophomonas sp.]|uniref:glycine--tRNA ligase subunit beta n=1 Tax=Syntrophomonas sp. TaxID=2053627 RepID=UPI0026378945|nr:glycine--tRNA ligase subunit beta [Syntrophomonas sp.]MDD2510286.1 glycine--tRNA ligase subunit beta [Syntrophomonas sp.]MDD3880544.1 glycine--tRNA ligase subunit beta [Syntrophomonas sp.]MDD4626451.1 glycine--tRNA ligase subunit beta [Syntrophomonas sp.]
MAQDLLLEIGVEEMPSAYMPRVLKDLKDLARNNLAEARLSCGEVLTWGTPRRLCFWVKEISEEQEDSLVENRGPKKSIAFDAGGNPSKAGLGFARGQGVDFRELQIREVGGVEYLFAIKKEKGQAAEQILPGLLLKLIHSLSFPKSMTWSYYQTRFARPIRWLLAILGDKILEFNIENIKSAGYTYGHRFLSTGALPVSSIDDYFRVLRKHYVILDQAERKKMIWQQVQKVAAEAGGKAMENEELLEEVAFLVEFPTAFYGEFSPSYLAVPPEVLTTSMIEHQRYFPVYNNEGRLLPGFVGVRNGTDYCLDIVRAGNERVLKARLEDALFFWNEDSRKSLEEMSAKLKDVLFHERLGTLADKGLRLQELALFIGRETGLGQPEKLQRSALLCKADLMSNMVYEFPELQGIMGRYYAAGSAEEPEVAEAIFEHYLPRFAGDKLPASAAGIVLSLAEKADSLAGCFAIGIKPSGSQDPYALRRQALGTVNIILDKKLSIDLKLLFEQAYLGYKDIDLEKSREDSVKELLDFVYQRMRGVLLDSGISYDVIDAALSQPSFDLFETYNRVFELQEFKKSPLFADFMVVYNRAHNLSRKWESEEIDPDVLLDESEKNLYQKLPGLQQEIKTSLIAQDYTRALELLAALRADIDQFFTAVMVMVDDEKLKAARLGILKAIANLFNSMADFSKIV